MLYGRNYPTLDRLRSGAAVNIEGLLFKMIDGPLKTGDIYIAERNTGPHLLTVQRIDDRSFIVPTCSGYRFDVQECVKVKWIE